MFTEHVLYEVPIIFKYRHYSRGVHRLFQGGGGGKHANVSNIFEGWRRHRRKLRAWASGSSSPIALAEASHCIMVSDLMITKNN